jgi:hypothetical protein
LPDKSEAARRQDDVKKVTILRDAVGWNALFGGIRSRH